jgi:hypothetical protein
MTPKTAVLSLCQKQSSKTVQTCNRGAADALEVMNPS